MRFPNEMLFVRDRNGLALKVFGDPKGIRARSSRNPNHISEIALDHRDDWDFIIDNTKDDIGNLQTQVKTFIKLFAIV